MLEALEDAALGLTDVDPAFAQEYLLALAKAMAANGGTVCLQHQPSPFFPFIFSSIQRLTHAQIQEIIDQVNLEMLSKAIGAFVFGNRNVFFYVY